MFQTVGLCNNNLIQRLSINIYITYWAVKCVIISFPKNWANNPSCYHNCAAILKPHASIVQQQAEQQDQWPHPTANLRFKSVRCNAAFVLVANIETMSAT